MADLTIVHFDIECTPGHWIGGDFVSKIITAVAWSERLEDEVHVYTHYDFRPEVLALMLAKRLTEADIVTGHYIRGFDLPLLNGELLRGGFSPLPALTTSDTKQDLKKAHGRSKSQKNLGALAELDAPKVDVTLADWEGFNTRRPGFEKAGKERVVGDVIQHKELREALIQMNWLGPVKVWRP